MVNFIYFVLVAGITMFSMAPLFLAAAFIGAWIYSLLLKGRAALKMNLTLSIAMVLIMVLINMLFNNNGATALFYIGDSRITLESMG